MVKQRRARPRPSPQKSRKTRTPSRASASRPAAVLVDAVGDIPPPPPRTEYIAAVALYEKGLKALQAHEFDEAAEQLRRVLSDYPEEKELHERARQYLRICERQMASPRVGTPRSVEERLYAATLAINAGDYEPALSQVNKALGENPENDHAYFMRSVVLTLRGNLAEALASLARSIELNPENHGLARQEPDLEALRKDDRGRQMLDALAPRSRRARRRTGARGRSSR